MRESKCELLLNIINFLESSRHSETNEGTSLNPLISKRLRRTFTHISDTMRRYLKAMNMLEAQILFSSKIYLSSLQDALIFYYVNYFDLIL